MPRRSVWPSEGDLATSSPARLPLPPTRFSTTTGWPSASPSLGAMRRATMSGPPPGGIGTSRRMGLAGYWADVLPQTSAAKSAERRLRMISDRFEPIPRLADPVQVQLPYLEVLLARIDHRVFHVQLPGETLDRAPARVGMLDVRLFVQLEEFEIVVGKLEQFSPALPLQAEPAVLFHDAGAVAGDVRAFGAGVGDDAFQPMPVRHQAFPGDPGELRRGNGRRRADRAALQADSRSKFLEDFPVSPSAAMLVIGNHLFAACADDADTRVPVGAVGRDLELQHGIALARIEPVLHGEHARPALCHLFVKITRAPGEIVDQTVQPREHAFPGHVSL